MRTDARTGMVLALCSLSFLADPVYAQPGESCRAVELHGRKVIDVCWAAGAIDVDTRAHAISERLQRLAESPGAHPIVVRPGDFTVDILSNETVIAAVFRGDAYAAHTSQEQLALAWAGAFADALHWHRTEFARWEAVKRIALASGAILLGLLLFALAGRASQRIQLVVDARLERLLTANIRLLRLVPAHLAQEVVTRLFGAVRMLFSFVILYIVVHLLLAIFPATQKVADAMLQAAVKPLAVFGRTLVESLPSLAFVALVGVVCWYALKINRYLFLKVREGTFELRRFRPTWAATTQRLVAFVIVVLGVLIAYPYIPGSSSPAFKGVSIFLGVLVSLGSTGLVGNLISGIMLTYMDAFQPGHYVSIAEDSGFVVNTTALTTRLRTRTNRLITVPNSLILSNRVLNYSISNAHGIIATVRVTTGYDVAWRQAEELLLMAAARSDTIARTPEPFVYTLSLNQFYVTHELDAYVKPGIHIFVAESELNRNVLDAFNEYGIQIMTPAYESDPARPKVVARDGGVRNRPRMTG